MSLQYRLAAVATAISLASIIATVAHADPSRLRGTVGNFDGSTLTVDTREGKTEAVMLNKDWKVSSVAKASIEDIKAGDYVGIASLAKADGGDGALEVLIFPAAMKGAG